jgi:predicted ArsR family transcriptional regulator
MLSSNPFASPVTISDKQALRLYQAIDGRKTVAELCSSIGMTINEVRTALQTLLNSQRIEIYTAEGRPADTGLLFKKP